MVESVIFHYIKIMSCYRDIEENQYNQYSKIILIIRKYVAMLTTATPHHILHRRCICI